MRKKFGTIEIILESDLCPGSGFSFAGVVDSDVSFDEYGIPYISGRRIKGVMREALALLKGEEAEKLFGKTGSDGVYGITI